MDDKPKRSDAQRRADAAYYQKTKGNRKMFPATFTTEELDHIRTILDASGIGNAELIRRAAARVDQGDDLKREYDAATGQLKPEDAPKGGDNEL